MAKQTFRWVYNEYTGNSLAGTDHDIKNEMPEAAAAIEQGELATYDLLTGDSRKYNINGHAVTVATKVERKDDFTRRVEHTITVE